MTCREEDTRTANRLWADYAQTHSPRVREALVHQFERLAYSIANRFVKDGGQNEDLFQVALMGLVKAVDRFDPSTNHCFSTFATPTIVGEIKRYFRDHSWNVHVPRGMQELSQKVRRASRELADRLGRTPTALELAARLEVSEEKVEQALALEDANRPLSLDGEIDTVDSDRPSVLEQCLGTEDRALTEAENRLSVNQALRGLSEPLRTVIQMRYLNELSQRECGRRLGLSQMQVNRLEKKALEHLRRQFAVH